MNRYFALLIAIGFLSVAAMGISMMTSHDECPLGKLVSCAGDALAMVMAHLNAFQILFAAVLILPLALAFTFAAFSINGTPGAPDFSSAEKYSFVPVETPQPKTTLSRWLALREHSPSFS